ncbi:MAG TPA: DUF4150 domain-containing protein, partial [Polyangiaceae bacterium]|nr:DUF4150 domain-containing protein [Polyangiaceae bacterium]
MSTESDKREIATTKSSHVATSQPQVSLVQPPPTPTGPAPTPFPIFARSENASGTSSKLTVGGAPVLVEGSSMDVDSPANQPSQSGGGCAVTHAVQGKGNVTMGSATTTVGGKGVARTGDMVALNCTAPNMKIAQGTGPLLEGAGGAGGKGGAGGDAETTAAGGEAQPSNEAKQEKAGASNGNPSPCVDGHPVAIESGFVVDDDIDLALPGAIPLTVERSYSSQRSDDVGLLGKGGWVLSLEQWIAPADDVLALRLQDGREAYFEPIGPGEQTYHRREQLELFAERGQHGPRYRLWDVRRRLWRHFVAQVPGGKARLTAIRDAHGNAITLEYDADRLTRIIDTAGRELRCVYDEPQRYLQRLEVWAATPTPPGQPPDAPQLQTWVDYAQDADECLAAATDAEGHAERYRYDIQRRMVQVTLKNGTSFYYAYEEEFGRCIKTWGDGGLHKVELDRRPGNEVYTFGNPEPRHYIYTDDGYTLLEETPGGEFQRAKTYDDDRYVLTEANAAGETYTFTYDERGHRTSVTDPAGNRATWRFDGDLPVEHVGRDGHRTTYEYDGLGSLVAATYPTGERYLVDHDAHGRVAAIADRDGTRLTFAYDAHHNLIAQTDARGATTRYWYDALGRPVVRQDALGRVTRVEYDRLGQPVKVTHADETVTQATYGPLGNVTRYVDPLGQVTEMRYGGTGVLLELTEPTGQKWRFHYDAIERLVRIENPRTERYDYRYDWAGQVVEERPFDGRILSYRYDKGERLCRLDRPDQTWRSFSYD